MAVACSPRVGSCLDDRPKVGEQELRQLPHPIEHGGADGRADLARRFVEVLTGIRGYRGKAAPGRDGRSSIGPRVERGDAPRQRIELADAQLAALEPTLQRGLVGQGASFSRPTPTTSPCPSIRTPASARVTGTTPT